MIKFKSKGNKISGVQNLSFENTFLCQRLICSKTYLSENFDCNQMNTSLEKGVFRKDKQQHLEGSPFSQLFKIISSKVPIKNKPNDMEIVKY